MRLQEQLCAQRSEVTMLRYSERSRLSGSLVGSFCWSSLLLCFAVESGWRRSWSDCNSESLVGV